MDQYNSNYFNCKGVILLSQNLLSDAYDNFDMGKKKFLRIFFT